MLQKLFISAVIWPLIVIGMVGAVKSKRGRNLLVLLIVPVYYMAIQSALWTEFRYTLPMYYLLLTIAAFGLVYVVRLLRGINKRDAELPVNSIK
jgi:uncharacterized membrane protein